MAVPDPEVTAQNNIALKVGGAAGVLGGGYLLKRTYDSMQNDELPERL